MTDKTPTDKVRVALLALSPTRPLNEDEFRGWRMAATQALAVLDATPPDTLAAVRALDLTAEIHTELHRGHPCSHLPVGGNTCPVYLDAERVAECFGRRISIAVADEHHRTVAALAAASPVAADTETADVAYERGHMDGYAKGLIDPCSAWKQAHTAPAVSADTTQDPGPLDGDTVYLGPDPA